MPENDLRLLALDGGGIVRGLSTLQILKKLMDTVDPDSQVKPCDYFDMIGGTSTGGLIAIMLGRLQMTVEACIDAFVSLPDRIFQKRRHRFTLTGRIRGRFDSGELELALKEIITQQGLEEDALLKDSPGAKCKVFVCATSKKSRGIVRFTSYRSPRGRKHLLDATKIWEAARATSAASTFFDPITIGPFHQVFLDGATGANNPVYELWNEAKNMWPLGSLEDKVKCLVSIGTGVPSLTSFKDNIIGIGKTLLAIATQTEDTAERFCRDKSGLHDKGHYYRFNVLKGLEDIRLEESKQKSTIIAATDRYIESQATFKEMKACANKISERQLVSIADSQCSHIAAYLRRYYDAARCLQIQRISGELLSMSQCYINLAVVEQQNSAKANSTRQHSHFSIFSRLKVETFEKDKQVLFPQLFESREQPDGTSIIPKRILIRGRAGVGKTTLCKNIVYDYLHHGMWNQLFDLLLWIPLQRLKGAKLPENCSLRHLFHHLYSTGLDEDMDLANDLCKTINDPAKKNKTLFILDGLDEVSQEWDSETPMNNILMRLLDHPQVITTSRPYGMNLSGLKPFDLELETIGFDANQVEAYITKMLRHDTKKADSILAFIQKHALIKGLARIPVKLDALCYCWDSDFMSPGEPTTMTTLYQAITLKLWQKDILRLGKTEGNKHLNEDTTLTLSPLQTQELVSDEINLLENLAFLGLYNEVIEFRTNDRHRIYDFLKHQGIRLPDVPDTTLKRISFLDSSDTTTMDQDRSYHFLDLTFQEFFAARYFVRHWIKDKQMPCVKLRQRNSEPLQIMPQSFLQKESYNSRYDIMWRFTAGLLQEAAGPEQETEESLKRFFQELEAEPRDLLGSAHQRLPMHCIGEVIPDTESASDVQAKIEEHLSPWLLSECGSHEDIWLGRERECSEHPLMNLVQRGSGRVKGCV